MLVLPHAVEVNDPTRALSTITNALNIRDPVPVSTDWPDDINGRLDAIQSYITAEIDALRPAATVPYVAEPAPATYVAEK